jgi:HlyD family secretion protein
MKRAITIIVVLILIAAFGKTLHFLYSKSQAKPVVYDTVKPVKTDIVKKTVATGNIVPRKEIEIKPRVSGIIDAIAVEPGDIVKNGDLIATIQIVPDAARLTQAQASVNSARISADNTEKELERAKKLRSQGIMPQADFNKYELDYELARERLSAAIDNVQVIKKGASRSAGKSKNTEVRSTVNGTILDVPVKEGMSVIESNTFNAGSTVAFVADMGDMIFQGMVDESEVGKVEVGMDLKIRVGALENEAFDGTLEYISPKGQTADGAIQFEIKAAIKPKQGSKIRAGYSANADIVLDSVSDVLAINESVLKFADKKPYVEVEIGPQQFERRDVEVGLSDGINIQIKSGIDENAVLKGREKR